MVTDDPRPDDLRSDHYRRPLLRDRLDQELTGLAATPQARRRLLEAAARTPARPWWQPAGTPARWTVPLVAAAVVAVIAGPVLLTQQLREVPLTPTATVTGVPGHPARTTSPPATSTSASPTPAPTASPTTDSPTTDSPTPASTISPAGTRGTSPTDQRGLLTVDSPVTKVGATVTATLIWLSEPAPSTKASQETSARVSTASAAPGTSAPVRPALGTVVVDWGDGQRSNGQTRCLGVGAASSSGKSQLQLRHVYRRPGAYRIVAVPSTDGCWTASQPLEAGIVAR